MKIKHSSAQAGSSELETIYTHRAYLARHACAPLAHERGHFLSHLVKQGSSINTAQNAGCYLLKALRALRLKRLRIVEKKEIERAIKRLWGHSLSENTPFPGCRSAYAFRTVVMKWLRFHNCLPVEASKRKVPETVKLYRRYLAFRNLAACTVEADTERTLRFLKWLSLHHKSLSRLSLHDVDEFVTSKEHPEWSIRTLRSTAQSLRGFVKFAAANGWCKRDFSKGIRLPSMSFCAVHPQSQKWSDIQRLVKSVRGNRISDVRAKAALLLISTYALRISEMARLNVSDFDFRKMTLRVRRSKNDLLHRLPLDEKVAKAVERYLRMRTSSDERLFLTIKTPFRPVHRKTFYAITSQRFAKLGIRDGKRGPHAIRHAVAIELLRKGTPLRQISDFLGHRRYESALTYAKYTTQSLRPVAQFKLGALL